MFSFLEITDGTVTTACELTDNINYALVSYAPIVSPLRESLLGDGVYSDVTESITVHALGCTAAQAYAAADKLNRLLDQAWRWWQGENVAAVNIRAMAQDSEILAPLAAAVKGRAPAGPANIALPAIWSEYFGKYIIQNIVIQFVRRGQWIGVDDATATSTPAANPSVHQVAFASSHLTSSPFDLVLSGFNFVTTPAINAGFLGVGSQANDVVLPGVTGATAANWTAFADAANLPMTASVLRYTPVATTPSTSGDVLIGFREGLVAVIAKVRNNSATTTWLVTGKFEDPGGNIVSMRPVEIDASTLNPRIVVLGVAIVNENTNIFTYTVQASAASGTLDFDAPMIVNLRDETCAVIAHDAAPIGGLVGNFTINFAEAPLDDTVPSVQLRDATSVVPVGYRGALPLNTIGQNVYAAWYSTNGNFWTFTNTANAKVSVAIQATRHRAYLIPQ